MGVGVQPAAHGLRRCRWSGSAVSPLVSCMISSVILRRPPQSSDDRRRAVARAAQRSPGRAVRAAAAELEDVAGQRGPRGRIGGCPGRGTRRSATRRPRSRTSSRPHTAARPRSCFGTGWLGESLVGYGHGRQRACGAGFRRASVGQSPRTAGPAGRRDRSGAHEELAPRHQIVGHTRDSFRCIAPPSAGRSTPWMLGEGESGLPTACPIRLSGRHVCHVGPREIRARRRVTPRQASAGRPPALPHRGWLLHICGQAHGHYHIHPRVVKRFTKPRSSVDIVRELHWRRAASRRRHSSNVRYPASHG